MELSFRNLFFLISLIFILVSGVINTKQTNENMSFGDYLRELEKSDFSNESRTERNNKSLNLGFITPWANKERGNKFILSNPFKFDIISPTWFDLKPELMNGKYNTKLDGSNYVDKDFLKKLKELNNKISIFPRFKCTDFTSNTLSDLISEKNSDKTVNLIVKRLKLNKFEGLVLECTQFWFMEHLYPLYVTFQQKLYNELKKNDKKLIVVFFPLSETLQNIVSKARFDYLSRYLDYAFIMTYDYFSYINTEDMDPNNSKLVKMSPENWVIKTVDHYVDKTKGNKALYNKMILGFSFHGFISDKFSKKLKGGIVESDKLKNLILSGKVKGNYDLFWNEESNEFHSEIEEEGSYNIVVPSSRSLQKRIELIENLNLGGVGIWEIGQGFENWINNL